MSLPEPNRRRRVPATGHGNHHSPVGRENAHNRAEPIDDRHARDGIDEMLMLFAEDPVTEKTPSGRGKDHAWEAATDWSRLAIFAPDGLELATDIGPAEATVSGPASDLWLYIMGRKSTNEMRVEGDAELAVPGAILPAGSDPTWGYGSSQLQ